MKDSLAKHITIFGRNNKLSLPSPDTSIIIDARRARAFEVCRAHAMWPTSPWPCRRKGGVDRRRERRRDAAR